MRLQPKRGFHVRLKPSAYAELSRIYRDLDGDRAYRVDAVDNGYGRRGLVLVDPATGRSFMAWSSQVTALPRCEWCQLEGHTKSRATLANCAAKREYAELKKAERTWAAA